MSIRRWLCALALGVAVSAGAEELAIERGQRHEQLLDLPAGQFVTLEVEELDIDLDAKVLDPGGAEVVRAALEFDPRISFITTAAGVHRLVLEPMPQSSQRGMVRIAVLASRPARADDRQRVE